MGQMTSTFIMINNSEGFLYRGRMFKIRKLVTRWKLNGSFLLEEKIAFGISYPLK